MSPNVYVNMVLLYSRTGKQYLCRYFLGSKEQILYLSVANKKKLKYGEGLSQVRFYKALW